MTDAEFDVLLAKMGIGPPASVHPRDHIMSHLTKVNDAQPDSSKWVPHHKLLTLVPLDEEKVARALAIDEDLPPSPYYLEDFVLHAKEKVFNMLSDAELDTLMLQMGIGPLASVHPRDHM